MGLPKNRTNNPEGRPKGSKNKTSEEIRSMVQSFVEANISKLQSEFDQLAPDKKLIFIDRMLSHVLPKPLNELEKLTDYDLDEIIKRLKNE